MVPGLRPFSSGQDSAVKRNLQMSACACPHPQHSRPAQERLRLAPSPSLAHPRVTQLYHLLLTVTAHLCPTRQQSRAELREALMPTSAPTLGGQSHLPASRRYSECSQLPRKSAFELLSDDTVKRPKELKQSDDKNLMWWILLETSWF